MDGMEVTQFTYFQQAGGRPLEVPAVEITYGLERIVMALQGVDHFKDIVYAPSGVTYGEMFLQNEYEMSRYNLDEADVEGQRRRFALYEAEARKLLDQRLPVPAYEHLLKLSHAFNVLDARGAVGVTERADCFATLRGLARQITSLWLTRREELGFPLLRTTDSDGSAGSNTDMSTASNTMNPPLSSGPATFVLEIGSEELPPEDVEAAVQQLRDSVPRMLDDLRLGHGGLVIEATPRRVAVLVHALSPRQSPSETIVRGPPVKVAYDPVSGAPTKALLGFCRKLGVTVEDCFVDDQSSSDYVVVNVRDGGKSVDQVLPEALSTLLGSISFRKSMRWQGDSTVTYSRPMRWLLALHGSTPLSFTYGNILTASNTTRLLRRHVLRREGEEEEEEEAAQAASDTITVNSADDYLPALQAAGIELSITQRRDMIWRGVQEAATARGGYVPDSCQGDLLHEVANLVESPTIVCGEFDPIFLSLPTEVLVTVMRKHQRYFPIMCKSSNQLLPAFVTVANGPIDIPTVRAGNQAVLRARFEDARFFYESDTSRSLEEVRPKLAGTMFHKELGSLLDKNDRVEALVPGLPAVIDGLNDHQGSYQADIDVAIKAAHLCKADLATSVVTEMTELAGVMGKHYALKEGYPEAVATAIFESVLPRHAGDQVPTTLPGLLVSLADKLDSLVGLFAAGCEPTASADPYGVRRAAVGLLQCLFADERLRVFDLEKAIETAASVQPVQQQPVTTECKAAVAAFVIKRLEQQMLGAENVPVEAVRAAVAERGNFPVLAALTARDIGREMESGEAGVLYRIMTAMARPVRLTRGKDIDAAWRPQSPEDMECEEERTLLAAYQSVRGQIKPDMSVAEFLQAAEALVDPLDAYFENVFVMCEDEGRRRGRLALMRDIAALPRGVLDLSELPGF